MKTIFLLFFSLAIYLTTKVQNDTLYMGNDSKCLIDSVYYFIVQNDFDFIYIPIFEKANFRIADTNAQEFIMHFFDTYMRLMI